MISKKWSSIHLGLLAIAIAYGLAFLSACAPPPGSFLNGVEKADFSNHIIVTNSGSRSVSLLDSDGRFVRDLYVIEKTSSDIPGGAVMLNDHEVLISIDGIDRIVKANLNDGTSTEYLLNSNLVGTLRGITLLNSGDLLVTEGPTIERFNPALARITTGGWPKSLQAGGTMLSAAKATGGFVHCSTTTDFVGVYDSDGTLTASATSGIVGTPDVKGCAVGPSSQVAAVFVGATDTIRLYSDLSLTTVSWNYSDTTLIGNPVSVGIRSDGKVLVVDLTTHAIVELSASGSLTRVISSSAVNSATQILVVP